MKICIAGGCGHFHTAVKSGIEIAGVYLTGQETPGFSFFVNRFGKAPVFDSFEEMLTECKPDIAVIDGFFGEHAAMAEYALTHGCDVYCEKPVALTEEQLQSLERAYSASGKKFGAMLTSRYEPCFYTMHEEILKGTIGELRLINAQKSYIFGERPDFFNDASLYGDSFSWVGIHSVDLIQWLSDCPTVASSAYLPSGVNNFGFSGLDDSAVAIVGLENGVISTVTIDYLRDEDADTHGDDRIRAVGTKGILEVKDERLYLSKDGECEELELLTPPDIFMDFIENPDSDSFAQAAFDSARAVIKIVHNK